MLSALPKQLWFQSTICTGVIGEARVLIPESAALIQPPKSTVQQRRQLQIVWGSIRPRSLLWFVKANSWQKKSVYKYIIGHRPYIHHPHFRSLNPISESRSFLRQRYIVGEWAMLSAVNKPESCRPSATSGQAADIIPGAERVEVNRYLPMTRLDAQAQNFPPRTVFD